MLFASKLFSELVGFVFEDMKENWGYAYEGELLQFLDYLVVWKNKKPGRQIVFVGGDLHLAGYSEVSYQKQILGRQLITSGINQVKFAACETMINACIGAASPDKFGDYKYIHHNWLGVKNYGTLSFKQSILDSTKLEVSMYLTLSDSVDKITQGVTLQNEVFIHSEIHSEANLIKVKLILLLIVMIIMFFY